MERAYIMKGVSFGMFICGCVSLTTLVMIANMLPLDKTTQILVIGLTAIIENFAGLIAHIISGWYHCQEEETNQHRP